MPPEADAVQNQSAAGDAPASDAARSAAGRIAELRVSANLMTLETGVYCVFPAPGSPDPDPVTGLPGVRVTPCPGTAGRPDQVSVSTFRADGWLENTAALVRVTEGPAQVLVTIYQAAGQPAETAPRLQVLRLSGDTVAPVAEPAPQQQAAPERDAQIMAHVQGTGDVTGVFGSWIGTRGSKMWIEGFGISDKNPIAAGDMEYQGVLGKDWLSPWVENGKFCGSRGMALPLLGLNARLKGEAAKAFTLRYAATFIDGTAAGPVEEGKTCESPALAALESFQIELLPRVARPAAAERQGTGRAAAPAKSPARGGRR